LCRANEAGYLERIVAFVDTLQYLDWKQVTDATRTAGQVTYVHELDTAKLNEKEEEKRHSAKNDILATAIRHTEALVPGMHGSALWSELYTTTPELNEIVQIPGIAAELDRWRRVVDEQARAVGRRG
jgi:hypothetical protein